MKDCIKFGTGGWRAVIGNDFIRENIMRVANGIALLAKRINSDKSIMIGYDRRFLSPEAAKWCAEVFAAHGIKSLFMSRSAPTPLVMHTVKDLDLDFGIEITASHNPAQYNGIKLFTKEGRDADVETTTELEEIIEAFEGEVPFIPFEECTEKSIVTFLHNPFNRFIDSIISKLDMTVIREKGPRILFDSMHGSGTYPIMVILYTARATIDMMNTNKDAYFGGSNPAPSKPSLSELIDRVVKEKYDLGIAVDGDGDRLGIVDSGGNYIGANEILVMLYYYLHEYKGWKGPVIRNLATTHMLDKIAESFGEECYEVPVGFKHISAAIDKYDAVLGGESSGGLTVRGHIHGKDSIYAASLFVEMFSGIGKSPTEFYASLEEKYGKFRMVEDNFDFSAKAKPLLESLLKSNEIGSIFENKVSKIGYEDGTKVYFEDGSFVIGRFSGTEPLLRIFAEAKDELIAEGYIKVLKDYLRENAPGAF